MVTQTARKTTYTAHVMRGYRSPIAINDAGDVLGSDYRRKNKKPPTEKAGAHCACTCSCGTPIDIAHWLVRSGKEIPIANNANFVDRRNWLEGKLARFHDFRPRRERYGAMLHDVKGLGPDGEILGSWTPRFTGESGVFSFASIWKDGIVTDLGGLAEAHTELGLSEAYAMNRDGMVIGFIHPPDQFHSIDGLPALWHNGKLQILSDHFPKDTVYRKKNADLIALNNAGRVVGMTYDHGLGRPVIWENGKSERLETSDDITGIARDISDTGVVVGYYFEKAPRMEPPSIDDIKIGVGDEARPSCHPCYWNPSTGRLFNLPVPGGVHSAWPYAVSHRGIVVGISATLSAERNEILGHQLRDFRAIMWNLPGHEVFDLNTLVDTGGEYVLRAAVDVNSRGQILCTADFGKGEPRLFGLPDTDREDQVTVILTPSALS